MPRPAGADHIVMDEAEITLSEMVRDARAHPGWRRGDGAPARRYGAKGQKPGLETTPVARLDLLDIHECEMMSVQYSRGCPFLC